MCIGIFIWRSGNKWLARDEGGGVATSLPVMRTESSQLLCPRACCKYCVCVSALESDVLSECRAGMGLTSVFAVCFCVLVCAWVWMFLAFILRAWEQMVGQLLFLQQAVEEAGLLCMLDQEQIQGS